MMLLPGPKGAERIAARWADSQKGTADPPPQFVPSLRSPSTCWTHSQLYLCSHNIVQIMRPNARVSYPFFMMWPSNVASNLDSIEGRLITIDGSLVH